MSNPTNQQAMIQQKRDVRDLLSSDKAKQEIAKVLPKHLTPERMTRVALTATLKTPALLNCTPESLLNAVLLCSQAGLEPDGRLAHLIPFGNQVQVIFDYKGLIALALRNGGMDQVYADKVCEHDEFKAYVEDGVKKIHHAINWAKPRGNPYAYYGVTRKDGQTDWEVMTLEEVEAIRQRSKAKDSGPWKTDFDEMGKKTVLKRMSKRWDLLPEIGELINADDDGAVPFGTVTVAPPVFKEKQAKQVEMPTDSAPPDNGTPAETPEEKPEATAGPSPVKKLRTLCAEAKLKEKDVLEFLREMGSISDDVSTFEEMALNADSTLTMLLEQFNDISTRIKASQP